MNRWRVAAAAVGALSALVIGVAGCGTARPASGNQQSARRQAGGGTGGQASARRAGGSGAAGSPQAAPPATAPAGVAGVPASGPVPAGFAATSVTFVSPRESFVLGTAPCERRPCTSIVRTLNRGRTWRGLPAPITPLGLPGVTRGGVWGIRFASPEHGFVFGNGLWETWDGGEHWTRDYWRRGAILSLATIDGQVLALTARCTVSGGCARTTTLLRRPLAGGRWRIAAYPGAPNLMALTDSIATQGRVAAVVAGYKVLVTRDGGLSFKGYATPCLGPRGHTGTPTSVAVSGPRGLALLCTGQGFTGHTDKWVYVSGNGGRTWRPVGRPSTVGDGGVISAATPRRLTIATASAASWLFYSADGGARWSIRRTEPDGGLGWADLGFTTRTHGVVVRGPTYADGNTSGRPGWLLLTTDAGAHWRRVKF